MGFIDLISAWQMQYEALQANGIYLFADAKQVRLQDLHQAAGSAVKHLGSFSGWHPQKLRLPVLRPVCSPCCAQ